MYRKSALQMIYLNIIVKWWLYLIIGGNEINRAVCVIVNSIMFLVKLSMGKTSKL